MIRFWRTVVFLAIGVSVAICRADPVLEDIVEQTYSVEPGATFRIRNLDGSIRIYGADVRQIKLQAIKKAYKADRLKQISVNASVRPNDVAIDTVYPPKPKWGFFDRSGTVDYIIVLPESCHLSAVELTNGELQVDGMRGGDVHASLVNGRMFGHNCFGHLDLNVTNGGIDVGYDWWETAPLSIKAAIVNGHVRAFLPGEAAFHLIAAAPHGHVVNEFADKRDRVSGGTRKVDTIIGGDAASEVELQSSNGSVQVEEVF